MTGPEILNDWMRNKVVVSNRDLALELEKRMEPDFPHGFKYGDKIHPSDISDARNAVTAHKFQKVTKAITKYFNLPDDYFGEFKKQGESESLSIVQEERSKYLSKNLKLMEELLEANREIQRLKDDKIALLERVRELERGAKN